MQPGLRAWWWGSWHGPRAVRPPLASRRKYWRLAGWRNSAASWRTGSCVGLCWELTIFTSTKMKRKPSHRYLLKATLIIDQRAHAHFTVLHKLFGKIMEMYFQSILIVKKKSDLLNIFVKPLFLYHSHLWELIILLIDFLGVCYIHVYTVCISICYWCKRTDLLLHLHVWSVTLTSKINMFLGNTLLQGPQISTY